MHFRSTHNRTARTVQGNRRNPLNQEAGASILHQRKVKDESAQLVASSLDIAYRDAVSSKGSDNASFRTIRYREGSTEKIERAQILNSHCGQLLVRTLRGNLMSVPASKSPDIPPSDEQCPTDNMSAELSKAHL